MTTKRFFPFQLSRDDMATAVSSMRPGRMVSLAANGTTPIDQQLADAFNSNNAVMADKALPEPVRLIVRLPVGRAVGSPAVAPSVDPVSQRVGVPVTGLRNDLCGDSSP